MANGQSVSLSGGATLWRGWTLTLTAAVATATVCSFAYTLEGGGLNGWSSVVRTSAKTSLLLFTAAFVASSARVFWRTPATAWLLANRRYLGVAFAASHAIHLLGIVFVANLSPDFVLELPTLIFGGGAYVLLFAMAATSFDGAAAWLGRRRWHLLHKTGMYWIWFVFVASYTPRMLMQSAWYAPMVALLFGAAGLRFAAWRRQRRA